MHSDFKNKKQFVSKPKIQGKTEQDDFKEIRIDVLSQIDKKNSVPLLIQVGGVAADAAFIVKMYAELISFSNARKLKVQALNDFDLN